MSDAEEDPSVPASELPEISQAKCLEAQATLIDLLDLEELDQDLYRGYNEENRMGRIFGGQVIAQSLMAAGRTVDDLLAHSLHGYFLALTAFIAKIGLLGRFLARHLEVSDWRLGPVLAKVSIPFTKASTFLSGLAKGSCRSWTSLFCLRYLLISMLLAMLAMPFP